MLVAKGTYSCTSLRMKSSKQGWGQWCPSGCLCSAAAVRERSTLYKNAVQYKSATTRGGGTHATMADVSASDHKGVLASSETPLSSSGKAFMSLMPSRRPKRVPPRRTPARRPAYFATMAVSGSRNHATAFSCERSPYAWLPVQ